MKNYVIINGVNSLTITGLAISKLPSISKPPLRVMTEEINGRDGDLITELGYGAYDKELVIGLYGNYDINEVIGFFNQEGTIVFSNEDDKYYNFKIINQIDYEALIKFRTATISLHCQPFKYPLTETPEEITTEYVEDEGETITLNDTKIAPLEIDLKGNTTQTGTPTPDSPIDVNVVSGDNEVVVCRKNLIDSTNLIVGWVQNSSNGTLISNNNFTCTNNLVMVKEDTTYCVSSPNTSITRIMITEYGVNGIFNTGKGRLEIQNGGTFHTANTTRYVRIAFNSTSELKVQLELGSTATTYEPYQSQTYNVNLGVENLLNLNSFTATTQYGVSITPIFNNGLLEYINVNGTFNSSSNQQIQLGTFNATQGTTYYLSGITGWNYNTLQLWGNNSSVFPTGNRLQSYNGTGSGTAQATGSVPISLYIYVGQTYNNVKIYPVVSTQNHNSYTPYGTTPIELCKIGTYQDYIYKDNGSWYLHKEVGKVVLNGSENWQVTTRSNGYQFQTPNTLGKIIPNTDIGMLSNYFKGIKFADRDNINESIYAYNADSDIRILTNIESTTTNFKTWLGTNQPIVYYVLATPTDTEITNTTLLTQLEALKGAMSYEGQTNISQVNNDLPFILSVKGIKEGSGEGIINNIGNIYAKPIIELEGTGTIGIYKNGTQYFEVDMSSDNEITIDTEKMEAYHNGVLKNRKVIGDYNKFTIDEGNNNIEITGDLTKATITKYTRYL